MIFILHEKHVLRKSKTHNINLYTTYRILYVTCVYVKNYNIIGSRGRLSGDFSNVVIHFNV